MIKKALDQYPVHPAVDWTTRRSNHRGRTVVDITCEVCGNVRQRDAASVAFQIRYQVFWGRCLKDRWVGLDRLGTGYPDAPGVDYTQERMVYNKRGFRVRVVAVTCDICQAVRWKSPSVIRCFVRDKTWTPRCTKCAKQLLNHPNGGRRTTKLGYVYLSPKACPPGMMEYFNAMRGKKGDKSSVAEHRLVAAATLKRPLTTDEVVHHKDGNRQNNTPENLEVFIRAKHHAGHGEFYYELQLAKAEIARLKEQLAADH